MGSCDDSPNHGLRANQTGLVIDEQSQGRKRWLVQFDERYPGGGIDGDKLWLDEHDFAEIVAPSDNVNPSRRLPDLVDRVIAGECDDGPVGKTE